MEQLTLPTVAITYMIWFDATSQSRKKITRKISEACAYYRDTRQSEPTTILVHPSHLAEIGDVTGVAIEGRNYIGRHTFYVTHQEG